MNAPIRPTRKGVFSMLTRTIRVMACGTLAAALVLAGCAGSGSASAQQAPAQGSPAKAPQPQIVTPVTEWQKDGDGPGPDPRYYRIVVITVGKTTVCAVQSDTGFYGNGSTGFTVLSTGNCR